MRAKLLNAPAPTNTVAPLGSIGLNAIAPIDNMGIRSVIGVHVGVAESRSVVFHTPPLVLAAYARLEKFG